MLLPLLALISLPLFVLGNPFSHDLAGQHQLVSQVPKLPVEPLRENQLPGGLDRFQGELG